MFKVDKFGNITVTQGDSGVLVQFLWEDKEKSNIFRLSEGEKIVFSVRPLAGAEPVIAKETTTQNPDGSVMFYLAAQETAELSRGEYVYDTALCFVDDNSQKNTYAGGGKVKRTFTVV